MPGDGRARCGWDLKTGEGTRCDFANDHLGGHEANGEQGSREAKIEGAEGVLIEFSGAMMGQDAKGEQGNVCFMSDFSGVAMAQEANGEKV